MEKVRVLKSELLTRLKENKEQHVSDYEDAHLIWRDDQVDAIDLMLADEEEAFKKRQEALKDLRTKMIDWEEDDDSEKAIYLGHNTEPESHEKEYDTAITMLEMSMDDSMTIEKGLFRQLVMDMWDWKQQFEAVTSMYLQGVKGERGPRGDKGDAGLRGLALKHIKGN